MKTRSAPQNISLKYQTRNRQHNNYLESNNPFLSSLKTTTISNIKYETSTLFSEIKLGKLSYENKVHLFKFNISPVKKKDVCREF